jgi:peptidoglycan-associated lipoprotein
MKMNKIIFPLVIALVATLAATGCKKGTPKVTVIPGHNQPIVGEGGGPGTIPPGGALPGGETPTPIPGTGIGTQPGGGMLPENWRPEDMNQDRAALAAYTVHFKFDSAVVQDKEQANIASVGQALTGDANAKLLIEGHCDERGTEEYNRSLGERRALALREALAKIGIDPMRIRTISYGKDKPADPGHAESAWSKNRRGEFVLCHPK